MAKDKCDCGLKRKVFCENCSAVKMSIMLKNGQKHLKVYSASSGRNVNPVMYSPIKYNHQSPIEIKDKLIKAFMQQSKFSGAVNCLLIHHNHKGYLIEKTAV